MTRVLTNNAGLRVTIESSIGVLPGSPAWNVVEFDNISAYGAVITTVARRPISQDRGRRKDVVTDLDSSVEYETDITVDALVLFGEGFLFAEYTNVEFNLKLVGAPPTATATTDDFNIDAASALLGGKAQFGTGFASLVFTKGYTNAANNGLHALAVDLASTDTTVQVATTLVTETPPANAICQFVGIRTDDFTLTIDAGLATGTLVSALDIDPTTLGLTVGQYIHIGSGDTSTAGSPLQNAPQIAATTVSGYARVTQLSATTITFDKADANLGAGAAGSSSGSEIIDLMFGRFLRNVPVTADADDNRYLERTYQFEASYPDLGGVGVDEYEYAIGNFANEIAFNVPLTEKATGTFGFIGTNSDDITVTRKTNAAAAVSPLLTSGFSTAANISSITTDVISSVSDVCFKSITLTLLNNVSPEKCLGTLGAVFVNAGLFQADVEGQMLFTDKSIVNAIKGNTTVTMAFIFENEDGSAAFDLPAMTLSGGGREFPVDQSVLVNITGASFTSNQFGFDLGISLFGEVPGVLSEAA